MKQQRYIKDHYVEKYNLSSVRNSNGQIYFCFQLNGGKQREGFTGFASYELAIVAGINFLTGMETKAVVEELESI